MSGTTAEIDPLRPSVRISRVFAAPRDLMFRIWTEPAHLLRWWAPHDFTVPLATFDARPGGRWRIDFRGPDGFTFPCFGDVLEIVPPERLVFTTEYREEGRLLVTSHVTATFADVAQDRTRVDIHATVTFAEPGAADSLAGMEEGWNQQIDKLELHAVHAAGGAATTLAVVTPPDRPLLLMRRLMEVPRLLVWSGFTQAEHMAGWMGPDGHRGRVVSYDAQPGGTYRIEQVGEDGATTALVGDFLDVVAPERLVDTVAVEGTGMAPITATHLFEDVAGGTLLTGIFRFASLADRDAAMPQMGVESATSYERLAALLASVAAGDRP
jgi:uncharacterized protein YndB with AHSA1/START domain